MPSKTSTDLIREIGINLAILAERMHGLEAKVSILSVANAKAEDALTDMQVRLALAESKVNDLKTVQDEKDRRRWTIWVAVVGSVLALLANVALIVFKK